MFIAAPFTIANQQNQPSVDEWMKKMQYAYTMEYYAAAKKNETMPFAGKWMDLQFHPFSIKQN
jgi:hypothetical protein